MTDYLRVEDLLGLTRDLRVGPVRDLGLLDSAARRPTTSLASQENYPPLGEKCHRMCSMPNETDDESWARNVRRAQHVAGCPRDC